MKPLYHRNAKRNLWATVRPWFTLSYWAYVIIRRKARKEGRTYAIISLPASAAKGWATEVSDEDNAKAVDAVVPPLFKLPPPPPIEVRVMADEHPVMKHFEKLEQEQDQKAINGPSPEEKVAAMKEAVACRIATRKETPEEAAKRILQKVQARKPI